MFSGTRLPVASDRSVGLRASMKSVVTEERLEWSWGQATQNSGSALGCDKACDVAPSANWSRAPPGICVGRTVALEKHTTQFANNSTDVPEKTEARKFKSRARGHKKQTRQAKQKEMPLSIHKYTII